MEKNVNRYFMETEMPALKIKLMTLFLNSTVFSWSHHSNIVNHTHARAHAYARVHTLTFHTSCFNICIRGESGLLRDTIPVPALETSVHRFCTPLANEAKL